LNSDIALVRKAYEEREEVVRTFFLTEAPRLAELCHVMARRFIRGGRLIAFGLGAAVTDAQHVSVEFVHPVIVGKRALPAFALPNDIASTTGLASADPRGFLARQLQVLGRREDIALGMTHGHEGGNEALGQALHRAAGLGMLSVLLSGREEPLGVRPDFGFAVPSSDPFTVQEVHETLYHVLWELVHIFFEHKGLLGDRPRGSTHDTGGSRFLYPFLTEGESDLAPVLNDVRASVLQKVEEIIGLRRNSMDPEGLVQTARLLSERYSSGGKILVFGNGGSATDAQDLTVDLISPPGPGRPLPAISLTNDAGVVTAVANDVGFDNVFARQIISYGREADVAVAISTSGGSRNVLSAVEEAKRRGLLTVCLAGYGGGRVAEICDRAHVVEADYVPRIQEAQASQYHCLRRLLELGGC
jgi:D-sedoheptulose 7-phosphate isomerase